MGTPDQLLHDSVVLSERWRTIPMWLRDLSPLHALVKPLLDAWAFGKMTGGSETTRGTLTQATSRDPMPPC